MFQEIRNTDFIQILLPASLGDVEINLERQRSRVAGCRLECALVVLLQYILLEPVEWSGYCHWICLVPASDQSRREAARGLSSLIKYQMTRRRRTPKGGKCPPEKLFLRSISSAAD
jgi:hypothetical protein